MNLFNWGNDDAEAELSPIPEKSLAAKAEAFERSMVEVGCALAALEATFLLWECGYTHEVPEPPR